MIVQKQSATADRVKPLDSVMLFSLSEPNREIEFATRSSKSIDGGLPVESGESAFCWADVDGGACAVTHDGAFKAPHIKKQANQLIRQLACS